MSLMRFPADETAHTPTGPVHCCYKHGRQIASLLSMMGCHVGFTDAPAFSECVNCKREADKRATFGGAIGEPG